MIRLFVGYDPREGIGTHVFLESLWAHRSPVAEPVSVTFLSGGQGTDGSNAFTYSRFQIPYLCGFKGHAIWLDGADMLLRAPIQELWGYRSPRYALQVVKHDYATKHPRKYVGTPMECDNPDYPRKNWSSVMIWNCGHPSHAVMEYIIERRRVSPHRFPWLSDSEIGELPPEWNWLADEYGYNDRAKLLHWTAGIPGFIEYCTSPHAEEWLDYRARVRA